MLGQFAPIWDCRNTQPTVELTIEAVQGWLLSAVRCRLAHNILDLSQKLRS
eukprot:SAG11_NODE_6103_length_1388_cov_1.131109_2_plen_51_part_00